MMNIRNSFVLAKLNNEVLSLTLNRSFINGVSVLYTCPPKKINLSIVYPFELLNVPATVGCAP